MLFLRCGQKPEVETARGVVRNSPAPGPFSLVLCAGRRVEAGHFGAALRFCNRDSDRNLGSRQGNTRACDVGWGGEMADQDKLDDAMTKAWTYAVLDALEAAD